MSKGTCQNFFRLHLCVCVCVSFLREEAEGDEEPEEAAHPRGVCTDGGYRRFSTAQGGTAPSREASQREETDARNPAGEHTNRLWDVLQ